MPIKYFKYYCYLIVFYPSPEKILQSTNSLILGRHGNLK